MRYCREGGSGTCIYCFHNFNFHTGYVKIYALYSEGVEDSSTIASQ